MDERWRAVERAAVMSLFWQAAENARRGFMLRHNRRTTADNRAFTASLPQPEAAPCSDGSDVSLLDGTRLPTF
jgi:hypothetical protein